MSNRRLETQGDAVIRHEIMDDRKGRHAMAGVITEPMETGEEERLNRLLKTVDGLKGKDREALLSMMAAGELHPLTIVELAAEINANKFTDTFQLIPVIDQVKPELEFYTRLVEEENVMAQLKDGEQVRVSISADHFPPRIEALKTLLDLYESGIRPDKYQCAKKIKKALEELAKISS